MTKINKRENVDIHNKIYNSKKFNIQYFKYSQYIGILYLLLDIDICV